MFCKEAKTWSELHAGNGNLSGMWLKNVHVVFFSSKLHVLILFLEATIVNASSLSFYSVLSSKYSYIL